MTTRRLAILERALLVIHTHAINGARYINGGVRSGENADLASGYANVVVLSPLGGRNGPLPEGQFEGLRRPPEWGADLASEVEALRKHGSRVEVITPDADSRAAMGTNQMDLATRRRVLIHDAPSRTASAAVDNPARASSTI